MAPRALEGARAESLGDRVEHAIEQHADAEREIAQGEADAKKPGNLRRNVAVLGVTGISLYLVAPSVIEVADSWRGLRDVALLWFAAMAVLQALATACLWSVQRTALNDPPWPPVVRSQLAAGALAKVAPGGGAMGAALQYRMLVESDVDQGRAVSGLTAVNLLTFAIVLALPILAVPAFVRGTVDRDLIEATAIGAVVFALVLAGGSIMLVFDAPLAWVGRQAQRVRNSLRRGAEPLTRLPERLQLERGRLLGTLGARWKRALAAAIGRWAFDFATLLAALAAVGATPRPALVLLAFCAAQVLAQVPLTPGGLGFVEAGLTATLAVAGVSAGDAVLATLGYRLFSYWLPLPVGFVAYVLHRRRLA